MKQILLILALMMLCTTVLADDLRVSRDNFTYYMQPGTSINDVIEIRNETGSRQCIDVFTDTTDTELQVTRATDYFCLNNNETTEITFTIKPTNRISNGSYTAKAIFRFDSGEIQVPINVRIGETSTVNFEIPQESTCPESITIPIDFINRESKTKFISMSAQSEALLPTFSVEQFQLLDSQTRTAYLRLNTNQSFQAGEYAFQVTVEDQNNIIVKKGTLTIRNCNQSQNNQFDLSGPTSCVQLTPGESRTVYVSLENQSDHPIDFDFLIRSNRLSVSTPLHQFVLDEGEIRSIPVTLRISSGTTQDRFEATVEAEAFGNTQTITICAQTQGGIEATFLQDYINVLQGEDFTSTLQIKNTTNQTQNISLDFRSIGSAFDGSFSIDDFSISGNSTRNVTVTIRTPLNAPVGEQDIEVRVDSGSRTFDSTLHFKILENDPVNPQDRYLRFLSYPSNIDMNAGQIKRLTFIIENQYRNRLSNLTLSIENPPGYVSFEPVTGIVIDQNDVATVSGILRVDPNAPNQIARIRFVIENNQYQTTQTAEITTRQTGADPGNDPEPNPPGSSFWSSLVTFGNQNVFLIGLIILILLLLLAVSAFGGEPRQKERPAWLSNR